MIMSLHSHSEKQMFWNRISVYAVLFFLITVMFSIMAHANQTDKKVNKLADSISPYLRQHQNNPVQWYEWGQEALTKAKQENKPILLSVGYSTCYWCHVLEREVFMHEDAAAVMNEYFINIKIDREVRPDLDMIFMMATQMLSGNGGWPNNVFLTPDLKPFHGVTYMPKDYWMEMTQKVALLWQNQQGKIEDQAERLSSNISAYLSAAPAVKVSLPIDQLALRAMSEKSKRYDNRYGGFGASVKFPEESDLLFLIDYAQGADNEDALEMVQNTVDHMLRGGIHDHVGGGFHRYSTEEQWHVPHFEKMLYNQAMMLIVLTRLYEHTEQARYKRAAARLVDYMMREITDRETGGFYSAQDAETDEVEGAYYVWTEQALQASLSAGEYETLMSVYNLAEVPDIPGHKAPEGGVLYAENIKSENVEDIDLILDKILLAREKRKAPSRDDKMITAWNGMMIYALAEASKVFSRQDYASAARKAADFLIKHIRADDGRLYRIHMEGQAHQNAFLEDYAWMARALVATYRATKDDAYLVAAQDVMAAADRFLKDETAGGYYMTDGSDNMFVRIKKGDTAGALPSGNAVMAHAYADLFEVTGDMQWKARGEYLTSAFVQGISANPDIYMYLISAMMRANDMSNEKAETEPNQQELRSKGILPTSKDKVNVSVSLVTNKDAQDGSHDIRILIEVEEGWHINANPATIPDLIPTTVNIQTDAESSYTVSYPKAEHLKTPLGDLDVYSGTVELLASVKTKSLDGLRALIELQACKEETCYAPSLIAVSVE